MFERFRYNLSNDPRTKQRLIVGLIIMFVGLLVYLLWPGPRYAELRLHDPHLYAQQQFGHLQGNRLFVFNGMQVISTDINQANSVQKLSGAQKLPTATSLAWVADKGAIMTFNSAFYGSVVDTYLQQNKLSLNEVTRNYTWYYDFKTGAIKPIATSPVPNRHIAYNPANNRVYFLADRKQPNNDSHTTATQLPSLYSYDTVSAELRMVLETVSQEGDTRLVLCEGADICLIGKNEKNFSDRLYALKGGGLQEMYDSQGRLYATSNPSLFLTIPTLDNSGDVPSEPNAVRQNEVVGYFEEDTYLVNPTTSLKTKLGYKISDSDPATGFLNDDDFFVIDTAFSVGEESDDAVLYRGGRFNGQKASTKELPVRFSDGAALTSPLIAQISVGNNAAVVSSTNKRQYIFSEQTPTFPNVDEGTAQKIVTECVASTAKTSDYFSDSRTFRIFFAHKRSFSADTQKFSDCVLTASPGVLFNYTFHIGGVSPDGRITTD